MNFTLITPASVSRGCETLYFTFTNTRVDEEHNYSSGNYLINRDGTISKISNHNTTSIITIVGGDNRFVHEKGYRESELEFTIDQSITMSHIMASAAKTNNDMNIESDDHDLLNICNSLFRGYAD